MALGKQLTFGVSATSSVEQGEELCTGVMPGLISIIISIDGKIMLVTDIISPISTGNHLYFLCTRSIL